MQTLIEKLESRTLMSASLDKGALHVQGTDGADLISVYVNAGDKELSVVIASGSSSETYKFAKSSIKQIRLDGGGGADVLVLGDTMGALPKAKVYGGDGDDILVGCSGDDELWGGAGDDVLVGGGGDDKLMGQDGNDVIVGDAGNDKLMGGKGSNILVGGEGNDMLQAHSVSDLVDAAASDHWVAGKRGTNVV